MLLMVFDKQIRYCPQRRDATCRVSTGRRLPAWRVKIHYISGDLVQFFISFLCVFFFFCSTAVALAPTTQEVEESLSCQCGCGLTVHSCNHLQCGFAVPAKQTIAEQVSQGKGKEEIVAAFVVRYGEKVLSAPTTSGFNLAAWITPFLAI